MSFTPYDIPPQENKGKWFRSHLLGREIELGELYSLGSNDLDLLMAETAEIRSDLDFKEKNKLGIFADLRIFIINLGFSGLAISFGVLLLKF